jgi:anti-sigma regulatory factor (Ser/Thr protein kinase)
MPPHLTSPPQPSHPLIDPPFGVDWWYRQHVPAKPWAVGQVRAAARWALERHGRQERADAVCLLASELVTNGIVHGKRPVSVCLSGRCEILRIEVYDPTPALPCARRAEANDEAGRGLALIAALAADWGTLLHPKAGGKSVWCELR